jgi:hypothetical protein
MRAALIAIVIGGFSGLAIGQDKVSEPLVKSALVFNISKFAQWPDGTFSRVPDSMIACVVGNGAFARAFVAIEGRAISGRRVNVRRANSLAEYKTCHVLVIPSEGFERVRRDLRRLRNRPILMFSDREGFAREHGAIEIVSNDQRIGFKVNVDRLRATGVKLSSKVLGLATEILRGNGAE